jgi:hypothetical protein
VNSSKQTLQHYHSLTVVILYRKKLFAYNATAWFPHYFKVGTGQPLQGNKLTSKAVSSISFEMSCTISTNQSSNGDNCHHHKEAVSNKNNNKERMNHAAPFFPGLNNLHQESP